MSASQQTKHVEKTKNAVVAADITAVDVDTALACSASVWRVGEIFAEFGVQPLMSSNALSKWELVVTSLAEHRNVSAADALEPTLREELALKNPRKVVKLKAATTYSIKVRLFSESLSAWGPWSEAVQTTTLTPVVATVNEIGEDYARLSWDRPPRDTHGNAPELDPEATQALVNIEGFELRILRESDMVQEFCDEFGVGVRTYTLHELRPETAYIVFVRYLTLIGSKKQWCELCRFITQATHKLSLERRGEDTFTVSWVRAPLRENTVGYLLPDSTVHKFEISVEGEGADTAPIELAATTRTYTATALCPGVTYSVRVRCLTKEGRWGARAPPLAVRTAERPQLRLLALGETFLSLGWSREVKEEETQAEYKVHTASNSYQRNGTVDNVTQFDESKVIHMKGLTAGTEFYFSMRTLLQGDWGLWTEPLRLRTMPRSTLVFSERGEDFLTVDWPQQQAGILQFTEGERAVMSDEGRYLIMVSRVEKDGSRQPVLEEEVRRENQHNGFRVGNLQPDSTYEVKCRTWQRNRVTEVEEWGEVSSPIQAHTLQAVSLQVLDMGEDFAQLSWRRALRGDGAASNSSHEWSDLKYEIVVGCLNTGKDKVLHREVLDTTYTVQNLTPNSTYVVSVRACDEREQWGLWSSVTIRTLAPVNGGVHEIGEDFVRLMWRRNDPTETDVKGPTSTSTADQYVAQYCVFLYSNENPATAVQHAESQYPKGGDAEHCLMEIVPSHHTSCRLGNLIPDRDYVAVVRALTSSGKWGLWCQPILFRTVSQFRIPVNYLAIGENYVNIVWSRDEHPTVPEGVVLGDYSIVAQQLRIQGVESPYSKDHSLGPDTRELKLYGLSPTTAYTLQIRACGKSGEWGLWSTPVAFLTRPTIATRPVEVAEDYVVLTWERKRVNNPKNYPTGKGLVTSYHLRVSNAAGIHTETFLGDGDCPYRISGLAPDTFYCVELKANYNDEEWGLWSTPLWCLTMRHLEVKAQLISEEFCTVKIVRQQQHKRLPEDDGNRETEDRLIAFGQLRSHCMLCVTSPHAVPMAHATGGAARSRVQQNNSLPADAADHRLIYQIELVSEDEELVHTIPNLKANTVYHASVRSKLDTSEWGMWSVPSLKFATVPTIAVGFAAIGENYSTIEWRRGPQTIPPGMGSKIQCGLGIVSKSRVKLRELNGTMTATYEVDSSANQLYIESLSPATTYAAAVQTFNDNHDWGMWSEESKFRTVASMEIHIEHITEDAVWASWMRQPDLDKPISYDTALNVDALVRNYEIRITGDGYFNFTRELDGNKLFFRGLQPDTVYDFKVRSLSKTDGHWGLWSSKRFRTQPTMRVTFGNIGEHFAVVEWRRHLPTAISSGGTEEPIAECDDIVREFRLKVEKAGEDEPVVYELSPSISSFRLTDLQPSSEYRVWMCARGIEGVWGLWNQEARVRTLPQLSLAVEDIGEDYVSVSWSRLKWDGEKAPDVGGVKVWEIDGAVSGYHVKVLDKDGNVFAQQHLNYTQTRCTLSHLNLRSMYTIMVCAKDTYNEWGLWSETRRFATLQPVCLNLLRIGEDHVHVEWERQGRLKKRTIEADTEEGDETDTYEEGEEDTDDEHVEEEAETLSNTDAPATGSETNENAEDEFGIDEFDEDVIRGDENVKQWHIRIYANRVFGGQPEAEDFVEFFTDPHITFYRVQSLLPAATYRLTIRGQNMAGEWGHWCHAESVTTLPLLVTKIDYVAETFLTVAWSRPETEANALICFPQSTATHNYQVCIRPLGSETPFDEEDEPLTNGARVYETTQPSLQLNNLTPGTRYRVIVKEEMIDPFKKHAGRAGNEAEFGVASEAAIVETIEPMRVEPAEIGESYAAVAWGRKRRPDHDSSDAITVQRSTAKITAYEIQAYRMDDKAEQLYKGPLGLEYRQRFASNVTNVSLANLVPNVIYSVSARAQSEGGHWGLWSPETKFVTLKRLDITVELVNEDSFVISWARALPAWAKSIAGQAYHAVPSVTDEAASSVGDNEADNDNTAAAAATGTDETEAAAVNTPPPVHQQLESVLIGDYDVHSFEVVVESVAVSPSSEQRVVLPNGKLSTKVTNLAANTIYSVSVRSMSVKQVWSLFSAKVSLCTLKGMELSIEKYSENFAAVSWLRRPQSIAEHSKQLLKLRDAIERESQSHQRRELFEIDKQRQAHEAVDGEPSLEDRTALSERSRKLEHYMVAIEETKACLTPEHVHLGRTDVSSYQLQLFGSSGCPQIVGSAHLCAPKVKATKSNRKRIGRQASVLAASTQGGKGGAATANVSGPSTSKGPKGQKQRDVNFTADVVGEGSIREDGDDDALSKLMDEQVNNKTGYVKIIGLHEVTTYELCVRASNVFGEWGPWSSRKQLTTLDALSLSHSRFGEHYINLFWFRNSKETVETHEANKVKLQRFTEEFKDLSAKDLEVKKATLSAEEYAGLIARLKEWRETQRSVKLFEQRIADGKGEVECSEHTPVVGYHLRVIQENGAILDSYFPESEDSNRQYTVTGLTHNTLYVVLICADYGTGVWGSWSQPIRFMTQNTIHLSVNYVSESFIDISWARAPNKKLAKADEGALLNPITQGRGHTYEVQVCWRDPVTDEEIDERRSMKDCDVFRIDSLRPDTRYRVAVREWDAKGEWGLWSSPQVCATLPGMIATVAEIGESWAQLSWARQKPKPLSAGDANAPPVLNLPVETVAYYLRVEELVDNGLEPFAPSECPSEANEESEANDRNDDSHDEDFSALFSNKSAADTATMATIVKPKPPEEHEPVAGSRFVYVKKFGDDTNELRLENLTPDRFYNVQVLCETTDGQLGTWSKEIYILSLSKIRVNAALIDEECVRLAWRRDPPRHHPRLAAPVITGAFDTVSYDLEAVGHERKNEKYKVNEHFTADVTEHCLTNLVLSGSYSVRLRATDSEERQSLWSDTLYFATLKPLKVHCGKVMEQQVHIEWYRDGQQVHEYPPTADGAKIHFGEERATQYHLRVFAAADRNTPILDRQFAGNVTKHILSNLTPNACYTVQARSCNVIGEWGLWSEERVVYTMKLIDIDVRAVGEDYINVSWCRCEPDELQDVVVDKTPQPSAGSRPQHLGPSISFATGRSTSPYAEGTLSLEEEDASAAQGDEHLVGGEDNTNTALRVKKCFPLLDRPAEKSTVYVTQRSHIVRYALSVTRVGETEDLSVDVPCSGQKGGTSNWTIEGLKPDSHYTIALRAFYGDDDWGLWSQPIASQTINLLAIQVKFVGEDYVTASWQRAPSVLPPMKQLRLGKPEETLCYEFVINDFTDVPIGEEQNTNWNDHIVRNVLVSKQKTVTMKQLHSNRRYRMSVRRWYRPIDVEPVALQEDEEKPIPEEQRLEQLNALNHAKEGKWSEQVFCNTLRDMVILVDEIAEDSISIRWDRDPNAVLLPTRQCVNVVPVTQSYHVRIDAMAWDGSAVDNSAGSTHVDSVFGPEQTTNRVVDLKPDSVYKIDVRCCTDKFWGLWSKTVYVVTLPRLRIVVSSIGEDYASLSWDRVIRPLSLPDGTNAVIGHNNNVEKYHLDMTGVDQHFRLEKKFKASRTSYRVKHLEAQTVYQVVVRSCDTNGIWSLWSDNVTLATLRPMQLSLGRSGEQFVHVSWERAPQSQEDYAHLGTQVQLGRTTVVSYHMCVFAMDQAPATAVVDKQFHGDVTKYRVTTLTPNTSYIVIIRACNDESQWGLWSEERVVRTQRILNLKLVSVGENYITTRWEREEGDGSHDAASEAELCQPVLFHLAITSEAETIDRQFTLEECTMVGEGEVRIPSYTTRGLAPDTKYLVAMQPCYGNDEWGLWTAPVTFLTLNRISIVATGVSEYKVELSWGRAQQNPELVHDPSIQVWRGTITKYQLLIRKVIEMEAAAKRERERLELEAAAQRADPTVESGDGANPLNSFTVPDAPMQPDAEEAVAVQEGALVPRPDEDPSEAPPAPRSRQGSLVQEPDELRIVREMDVKHAKYIQTSCTIDQLQANTDYHVQVRALDEHDEWGCWTELLFDTPPLAPNNLTVRKSGAQFILLRWDMPDTLNRYQFVVEQSVLRDPQAPPAAAPAASSRRGAAPKNESSEWKTVDTVEDAQCRVRAFGVLNKMRFRVKCCKLDRPTHIFSQYSDVVGLSTTLPPDPVASVAVATLSRNSATIEWTKPATSPTQDNIALEPQPPKANVAYRVLLSVKEQPPVLLATTRNTAYTLNDLEPNTTYKVQVQVENENGLSQRNVMLKFTTRAEGDKSVTRAQAGQPPLGTIIAKPDGAEQSTRLPTIAHSSHAPSGSKQPKPPADGPAAGTAPKRPNPLAGSSKSKDGKSSPKKTSASPLARKQSPQKPSSAPGGTRKQVSPPPSGNSKTVAPRPPRSDSANVTSSASTLPPVRSARAQPQEQFDVVTFHHSDDEAN